MAKLFEIMVAASPALLTVLISTLALIVQSVVTTQKLPDWMNISLALTSGALSLYVWGFSQLLRNQSTRSYPNPIKIRRPVEYEGGSFLIFFIAYFIAYIIILSLEHTGGLSSKWRVFSIATLYSIPLVYIFGAPESDKL